MSDRYVSGGFDSTEWDKILRGAFNRESEPIRFEQEFYPVVNVPGEEFYEVYDMHCTACAYQTSGTAPISKERFELWECPECHALAMRWRLAA